MNIYFAFFICLFLRKKSSVVYVPGIFEHFFTKNMCLFFKTEKLATYCSTPSVVFRLPPSARVCEPALKVFSAKTYDSMHVCFPFTYVRWLSQMPGDSCAWWRNAGISWHRWRGTYGLGVLCVRHLRFWRWNPALLIIVVLYIVACCQLQTLKASLLGLCRTGRLWYEPKS